MSRPYRIEFPGAVYHVTSRGNNRQPIVSDDQDRRLFISLLARTVERFALELYAFCLMDNHYHLFLRTPQPNLHLALQWLGANYTRAFNHRHGRDGHLFKSRYYSVLVDDNAHWLHLSAYIHLNPVRSRLVKTPAEWPWSSARDYLASSVRYPWVQPDPILASFGPNDSECRRRYRRHLAELAGLPDSAWESLRDAFFLGSIARWEAIKQEYPPAGRMDAVVKYHSHSAQAEGPVDFEEELSRLARFFVTTAEEIRAGGSRLRAIAYYHLVRNRGLTGSKVAELFEVGESAVSLGMRRLEEKMAEDDDLRRTVSELYTLQQTVKCKALTPS